jgi:hypothetical protein
LVIHVIPGSLIAVVMGVHAPPPGDLSGFENSELICRPDKGPLGFARGLDDDLKKDKQK